MNVEFSYKLASIVIDRSWADYSLLADTEIGIKGYKAGTWNVPYVVVRIVVARDVTIKNVKLTNEIKSELEKMKPGGGISIFGFGVSAAYENTTYK